jgi:hypothetical protein
MISNRRLDNSQDADWEDNLAASTSAWPSSSDSMTSLSRVSEIYKSSILIHFLAAYLRLLFDLFLLVIVSLSMNLRSLDHIVIRPSYWRLFSEEGLRQAQSGRP